MDEVVACVTMQTLWRREHAKRKNICCGGIQNLLRLRSESLFRMAVWKSQSAILSIPAASLVVAELTALLETKEPEHDGLY
jgi:hypothetical protein